ncbi:MAG: hypothetical protein M5U12_34225 [Verrucomicrobia bacterium]|nr:hypothetical protein [Verrucomicrobiota bacterium]
MRVISITASASAATLQYQCIGPRPSLAWVRGLGTQNSRTSVMLETVPKSQRTTATVITAGNTTANPVRKLARQR